MEILTFIDNENQVKQEFDKLQVQNPALKVLSMGISVDYVFAIDCDSIMLRVGSAIFGKRNYSN